MTFEGHISHRPIINGFVVCISNIQQL